MKNKGKILKICTYFLVIVLVTMSILAACAKPAPAPTTTAPAPGPAPTTTAPPAPGPAPTTTAPPAPGVLKPYTAKFTMGTQVSSATMDPALVRYAGDYAILFNMFDVLVGFTPDGKPKSGLGLSTYEVTQNGAVFTFTLRKGVKFHNGDPLTSADVLFTHERMMAKSTSYPVSMRDIDKVEAIDDYTIRFTFKKPQIVFMLQTAPQYFIVSKNYYDRVGEEKFSNNPVGSGPYKFVEWKMGQYLDLAANEDYWAGAPQIKNARFIFVPENTTRVAMLKAGEVDMIADVPYQNMADLQKSGYKIAKVPPIGGISLQFHTMNPSVPWYDKRVRQACRYAIDREGIVKNLFYGVPEYYTWLAPGEVGYDPSLEGSYPYDVAKAKALLVEAGYPNGFNMPLYSWSVSAEIKDVTEAVVLYLKAIGITCKVTILEGPMGMDVIRKSHADPTAQVVMITPAQVSNNSDPVVPLDRAFWSGNPGALYKNPQIDALYEKATSTYDEAARGELVKQIFKIVNDDVPLFEVIVTVSVFAMKPNVDYKTGKLSFRLMSFKDASVSN